MTPRRGVHAEITGTGRFLPGPPIDSAALEAAMPDLPIALFERYFGVKKRHYVIDLATGERRPSPNSDGAGAPLGTTEMAVGAARRALERAKLAPSDIDLVITNSTTPDSMLPPLALLVQQRLGIGDAQLLDLRGGCSAAIQAANVANMLIEGGHARAALVVSAECTSPFYLRRLLEKREHAFEDVINGLLFADGAGAIAMQARTAGASGGEPGIGIACSATRSCFSTSRAGFALTGAIGAGGIETRHDHRAIRKTLPRVVERAFAHLRDLSGRDIADYDVMIIPQVNRSMINIVAGEGADLADLGFCYYGDETGNVPAAAMFMALDMARERGRIGPGDHIGVVSIETTSWNYAIAALQDSRMEGRACA
jgi:3-oxoacyl-[acyl-carrier-protein] synthase-3